MSGAGALKDEQVWVAWWCCHGGDSDVALDVCRRSSVPKACVTRLAS